MSQAPKPKQLHLVLPPGTKVLTRADGRVGLVAHAPDDPKHRYRVRFADGTENRFSRHDLTIFKHTDAELPGTPDPVALRQFVIYRCVVGSTASGLNNENSDVDRRGFYLPPANLHWGLAGVPEQLETEHEECYWEIGKFIRLGLKANPNILECLYSPIVETCSALARELIDMRQIFLSKHVHRTYNSYVLSQFKKMEQDLRNQHEVRWKHVMHLIRLLLSGATVLRDGLVPLRADAHRDRLLAIRRGEIPWEQVENWRLALHRELDDALGETRLPDHPDYDRANDFLITARRHAASIGFAAEVPVIDFTLLKAEVAAHPYPLLFAAVSGAHLYGFPSPDSDYDLRGVHILPPKEAMGLLPKRETLQVEGMRGDIEMDLVTHDILKFFSMLLKRNGYVLEQLYSPLIVQSTPAHEELKEIARGCVTRHHAHHYLGFAATQWDLFRKEDPPRVKPLLYVYRVLLTGIRLMRTGRIEANLLTLNEEFRLPYIQDLVARKVHGVEKATLEIPEVDFHRAEYEQLVSRLESEGAQSSRPDAPDCLEELNDLLIRVRLAGAAG